MLNGEILGTVAGCHIERLVAHVRQLGRAFPVPYCRTALPALRSAGGVVTVFSAPSDGTVYIQTDEGRVVRPFLVVDGPSHRGARWVRPPGAPDVNRLLASGDVGYFDAMAVLSLDVALSPDVLRERPADLLEVHAHLILGVTAALIPLLQANQPRLPRACRRRRATPTKPVWDPGERRRSKTPVPRPGTSGCGGMHKPGSVRHVAFIVLRSAAPLPRRGAQHHPGRGRAGVPHGSGPGRPPARNLVIAVVPYGGENQNDSVVLRPASVRRRFRQHAVQRGLGLSLAYHTRRFDVHPPFRLCGGHASVPGGLGVLLPGSVVYPGQAMIVVHVPGASESEPVQRCANSDDAGIVHRVILSSGNEGSPGTYLARHISTPGITCSPTVAATICTPGAPSVWNTCDWGDSSHQSPSPFASPR